MKRLLLFLSFLLFAAALAHAQISISGIYTFEIKKGGKDSKPKVNKVDNEFLQFNIRNLQLFLDASVADDISLSAKLASTKRVGDAIGVDLELAYVTFSNIAGRALNISAGKTLTPFGTYTRRQLSPDNPLIGTPLFFYYSTNVSPASGYLDSAGVIWAETAYGGRLSTVYYGGYYTGLEVFGSFADELLLYDLAVMNAPLSSPNPGLNLDKEPAFHGRIAVHPAIWGTLGVSFASGSFLERGMTNSFLDWKWSVENYKQRTIGIDVNLNHTYYEINAEYIVNNFHSPFIVPDSAWNYKSGLTGSSALDLESNELLVDVKIDAPFYPGLYLAARYNAVMFGSITDPDLESSAFGKSIPWDRDVQRFEVAIGYKVARSVLVKLGYQWTKVDVIPRPQLDVAAAQVSVSF
ncbi:MAG TPA: hypothetical protein VJB38_12980 [Bacteroidota bacterium]|nr:hypothetical protein [Bacteroidota bacterium]